MSSSNLSIYESKRELSEDVLSNMKIKKPRKSRFDQNEYMCVRKEITCIENLSNEIFYEIFDYLDGSDIFYGFLSLNIRFNHLINHSSLSIKISRSTSFSDMTNRHYQQLIIANRHRIISLHLQDKLHTSFFSLLLSNNELLNRLESLILDKIQYDILMSLVRSLTILPRLFSLTIYLKERERDLEKLYSLIFGLPMLKYNKLSIIQHGICFPVPLDIGQFSPVEHLVLDYSLTVLELYKILFCTPHLTHLSCKCLNSNMSISKKLPINTFNLRYISFEDCCLCFDEFEILAKNLFSQIRILHCSTSFNLSYFNIDRWQRLILQVMPHLRILNFKYHELTFIGPALPDYYSVLSRSIPSFWIERKWFLELEFHINMDLAVFTNFYIQPLKKQWYDLPNDITYSTITQQKCINTSFLHLHLVIKNIEQLKDYRRVEQDIYSILNMIQFTSLHITLNHFSMYMILKFLHRVPNLDSLTITSEFQGKKNIFF